LRRPRRRNEREDRRSKYKTNEQIRYPEVRVIEGLDQGVYKTSEALIEAENLGLDLILVTEKANPPVCKVMEFSKFLYQEKQKEKDRKSNKTVLKEVQFTPNIGEHDYEVKKKNVIKFLQQGNKVKATVFFKGRTIMFKDKGTLVLTKLATEVEEYGTPEAMPNLVGKRMMFIIKPKNSK
jgi:translation initiation factor IF-3